MALCFGLLWPCWWCSGTFGDNQELCAAKSTVLLVVQSSFCNGYDLQLLLELISSGFWLSYWWSGETVNMSNISAAPLALGPLPLSPAPVTCSQPSDGPRHCYSHFGSGATCSVAASCWVMFLPVQSLLPSEQGQHKGGNQQLGASSKGWQMLEQYCCQRSDRDLDQGSWCKT